MNKIGLEDFIKRARVIHGDTFDYSKFVYTNNCTKSIIICPVHGEFLQTPYCHIVKGFGCRKCSDKYRSETQTKDIHYFISKAKETHGDRYDYSQVKYTGIFDKVKIICPNHGIFEQIASNHIRKSGCPKCKMSTGERKIKKFLEHHHIEYEMQKSFDGCKNKYILRFDFYLPNKNTIIEYDGIYHFQQTRFNTFDIVTKCDSIKNEYCYKNNIKLIRIPYWDYKNIDYILQSIL